MESFLHPQLYLADTPAKGRGMFTEVSLPADTLLEVSPIIPIDEAGKVRLHTTLMRDYIFNWGVDGCCVGLGYLSIYNHSYTANCSYIKHLDELRMSIRTIRDIEAGEELCTNYNGVWDDPSPLIWFEAQ